MKFFISFSSFSFFLLYLFSLNLLVPLSMEIKYFTIYNFFSWNFNFLVTLDQFFFIFVATLCLVTFLVLSFASFYMDSYNNSKLFLLLFSFFFSMFILLLGSSPLFLMLGWDFLGVTSILLIMFYPNLITSFNSTLTMSFNRMGDVILIFSLCLFLESSSLQFFLSDMSPAMALILVFCSFTKSAQYPFSSWLPAAMSAPTPISAMVHSSTLVTAGVFLIFKSFTVLNNLLHLLSVFSLASFILGGFVALVEKDFKKLVAFSTLSQISMIIYFICLGSPAFSLTHIMSHALFKSVLFCSVGGLFITLFSSQFFHFFSFMKSSLLTMTIVFLSVFSMTGWSYSLSFFSKDFCLNKSWEMGSDVNFILLLLGSFLTVGYSAKVLSVFVNRSTSSSSLYLKEIYPFSFLVFFIFSTHSSLMKIFFPFGSLGSIHPFLFSDFQLISFLVFMAAFFSIQGPKLVQFLGLNIFYLNFFTYPPVFENFTPLIYSSSEYPLFKKFLLLPPDVGVKLSFSGLFLLLGSLVMLL